MNDKKIDTMIIKGLFKSCKKQIIKEIKEIKREGARIK